MPERRIGEPEGRRYPTFDVVRRPSRGIRQMTDLPGGLISDSDDDGSDDDGSMDGGMDTRLRVLLTVALLSIIVGGTADLLTDDLEFWLSVHAAAAWSAGC